MKRKPRIYYTDEQKALMWERWRKGESLQHIAELFDRCHGAIQGILIRSGGISPAQRCRSRLALTVSEREEISRSLVAGVSLRGIAFSLGRAPSTISREIKRNGGQTCYRASPADKRAWDRAKRPKRCKLVGNPALASIVADKLQLEWAPEQIAGWLKHTYTGAENFVNRAMHGNSSSTQVINTAKGIVALVGLFYVLKIKVKQCGFFVNLRSTSAVDSIGQRNTIG